MNKVVLGLLVGGLLGIFDGLTAWFTPDVRAQLLGNLIGSTVKGLTAGILDRDDCRRKRPHCHWGFFSV